MSTQHRKLPKFNSLPKIIEITKDKEVPRKIIINDLVALEKELRERRDYIEANLPRHRGIEYERLLKEILEKVTV